MKNTNGGMLSSGRHIVEAHPSVCANFSGINPDFPLECLETKDFVEKHKAGPIPDDIALSIFCHRAHHGVGPANSLGRTI